MFKELVVTSFYCEECGNKNTNVEFGGKISDFAVNISLNCTKMDVIFINIIFILKFI